MEFRARAKELDAIRRASCPRVVSRRTPDVAHIFWHPSFFDAATLHPALDRCVAPEPHTGGDAVIRFSLLPLQCLIALLSLASQFGRRFCAELDAQCNLAMRLLDRKR
jgi:hypothetical protein